MLSTSLIRSITVVLERSVVDTSTVAMKMLSDLGASGLEALVTHDGLDIICISKYPDVASRNDVSPVRVRHE